MRCSGLLRFWHTEIAADLPGKIVINILNVLVPRCAFQVPGCATRNDEPLHAEGYNHAQSDVAQNCGVSYRDGKFLETLACGTSSFGAIELDCLTQSNAQRLQEFFASRLLTVDSGNLLNPANPPIPFVFHYRSEGLLHKYLP